MKATVVTFFTITVAVLLAGIQLVALNKNLGNFMAEVVPRWAHVIALYNLANEGLNRKFWATLLVGTVLNIALCYVQGTLTICDLAVDELMRWVNLVTIFNFIPCAFGKEVRGRKRLSKKRSYGLLPIM